MGLVLDNRRRHNQLPPEMSLDKKREQDNGADMTKAMSECLTPVELHNIILIEDK
jgi:hypothetical protein